MAKIDLSKEEIKELLVAISNTYRKPGYDVINKLKTAYSLEESGAQPDPDTGDFYIYADLSRFISDNPEVVYEPEYARLSIPLITYDLLFSKNSFASITEVLDFVYTNNRGTSVLVAKNTGYIAGHSYNGFFGVYVGEVEYAGFPPPPCCVANTHDNTALVEGHNLSTNADYHIASTYEVTKQFFNIRILADISIARPQIRDGLITRLLHVVAGLGSTIFNIGFFTVYRNTIELWLDEANQHTALDVTGQNVLSIELVPAYEEGKIFLYVGRKKEIDLYEVEITTDTISTPVYVGTLNPPEGYSFVYPVNITSYYDPDTRKSYAIIIDSGTGIVYTYEVGSLEPSYYIGIYRDPTTLASALEFWDPYTVRYYSDGSLFVILDRATDTIFSISKEEFFKTTTITIPVSSDNVVKVNGLLVDIDNPYLVNTWVSPDNGTTWIHADTLPITPLEGNDFLVKLEIRPVINQIVIPYGSIKVRKVGLKIAI